MESYLQNSIQLISKSLNRQGWSGYDPYDIKGHPWIIPIIKKGNSSKIIAYLREFLFEIFYTFPKLTRKLLGIKPQINAKGMGLFAKAYLELYISTENKSYLEKSRDCISWLNENKANYSIGSGWGYPFDWQSTEFIPKNSPNGIVTTAVGDAFWSWYKFSGENSYLQVCIEICHFLESLPKDIISEDKLCFSYTPLFQNHVHNLNLFVAEFLIKVGQEVKNNTWIELGIKATNYTIEDQIIDGSFDYNGPPEKPNHFIDNYHTGFVLRMLHSIWKLTGRNDVYSALEKCYNHYLINFFEDNRIPKLMPDRKYRIDIHSCAESINCLCELSETFPQGIETAKKVLFWTVENLQDNNGYFYYGIHKSRFFRFTFTSKIQYIRWGQAWMLKALSNYVKYVK